MRAHAQRMLVPMVEHPAAPSGAGGWMEPRDVAVGMLLLVACSGSSGDEPPHKKMSAVHCWPEQVPRTFSRDEGCRTRGVLQPMGGILGIPFPTSSLPHVWWKRGRLYAVRRLGRTGGTPRGGKSGPKASAPWAVMAPTQLQPGIAGLWGCTAAPWKSVPGPLGPRDSVPVRVHAWATRLCTR